MNNQLTQYLNAKQYHKVLLLLDTPYKDSISSYQAALLRGICLFKISDFDRAKIALQECSRLSSTETQHLKYSAKVAIAQGNYIDADTYSEQFLRANSSDYYAYVLRAKVHRLNQNINSAVADLNSALRLNPNDYKIYKHLGLCYFDSDYEISLKYLLKAEQLSDSKLSIADALGYLYMRMEEHSKALDQLKRALSLSPNEKKYYYLIGLCYYKMGQKHDALEHLKIAIDIDSNDPNIYFMVGVTEKEVGNYQEAIRTLEKSIQSGDSINLHAKYNEIGLCYLSMKDHEKAAENFIRAIENKANYAEAHSNLGLCYFLSKKHPKALEELNKAVKLDDHLVDAYSNLGLVLMTMEKYKEAEQAYNKVVIYPDFRYDALIKLGTIKLKRKKYSEAKNYFKTAVQFNNSLSIAYYNLGIVYADLRKCTKARENFAKALQIDPQFSLAKKSMQNLNNQTYDEIKQKKSRGVGCGGFFF